jgi:hypothetical protein
MSSALFLLLMIFAMVLLWLDGARARELATGVVDELCQRRGLQLLDGTVALRRLGLARTEYGMRIKRLFRFDYSVEGVGRQQGHILLHGSQVVLVDLPQQTDERHVVPTGTDATQPPATDGKVVPFRRRQ